MNAQRKKIILVALLIVGAATAALVWFSGQPKPIDAATEQSVQELAKQGGASADNAAAPEEPARPKGSARQPIKP